MSLLASRTTGHSIRRSGPVVVVCLFAAVFVTSLFSRTALAQSYPTVGDATIRDAPNDNNNYGGQTLLTLKYSSTPGDSQVPIMQFDLTNVAPLGVNDQAFLLLQGFNDQAGTMPFSVFGFPFEWWDEHTVTDNIFWSQPGGIFILYPPLQGSDVSDTLPHSLKIDVTDFVQAMIAQGNPYLNPTFILGSDLVNPSPITVSFRSKESGLNVAPQLSIQRSTMTLPPTQPCTQPGGCIRTPACDPSKMGASCTFHPQACLSGTQMFPGQKMACSTQMDACTPNPGSYCVIGDSPQCGGPCGLCPGGGCTADSQCYPTLVCDTQMTHQCQAMFGEPPNQTSACPVPHLGFCWAPGNAPSHDSVCN